MCFCWYQCGKDEVRAPLAWLKTHTERVPTTNAKAIELNSRLCLTVLHGPAWLAPDLCVCVACASVCVCVCAVYVSNIVYVCCVLTVKREGVSEWASYRERERQSDRESEREREGARTREWANAKQSSSGGMLWVQFTEHTFSLAAQWVLSVCVCVRVYVCICLCVYTWWRETGLLTFLACYFLYKGTHTHTQTRSNSCSHVFVCTAL